MYMTVYNPHLHVYVCQIIVFFTLYRTDVRFTLPAKAPSPPQVPVRFTRPLSDGPHLVDISDEVRILVTMVT